MTKFLYFWQKNECIKDYDVRYLLLVKTPRAAKKTKDTVKGRCGDEVWICDPCQTFEPAPPDGTYVSNLNNEKTVEARCLVCVIYRLPCSGVSSGYGYDSYGYNGYGYFGGYTGSALTLDQYFINNLSTTCQSQGGVLCPAFNAIYPNFSLSEADWAWLFTNNGSTYVQPQQSIINAIIAMMPTMTSLQSRAIEKYIRLKREDYYPLPPLNEFIQRYEIVSGKIVPEFGTNLTDTDWMLQKLTVAQLNDFYNYFKTAGLNDINAVYDTKFAGIGLTRAEFLQFFTRPAIFEGVNSFITNSKLSNSEKLTAILGYLNAIDWSQDFKLGSQTPTSRDVRLDLANLENNPNFIRFTTVDIRNRLRLAYPNLEQYKINISAGVALENAYAQFTGYQKGFNLMAERSNSILPRLTRPDFLHATFFTDQASGTIMRFGMGGVVEVKCPQNPIQLSTNNHQIDAEISIAKYARQSNGAPFTTVTAGQFNAAAYTLVLPYGGMVAPDVVAKATASGVNMYVSYAFINRNNDGVVFSNPQRLNNISNEATGAPGNLDMPIALDFNRAVVYWQNSNDSSSD